MAVSANILAVGDLHGCRDLLEKVLNEVVPQVPAGVRLVFLGDYIDRGPDSAGVLEVLLQLRRERPDTVLLMGNHERMLLDAVEGRNQFMFRYNGGEETLASYGLGFDRLADIPPAHLDLLRGLPLYHQEGAYLFVHAGLRPGVPLERQEESDFLWIREEFYTSQVPLGRKVIFGHTPFPRPLVRPELFGIDTGAVYGGQLSCLHLPSEKFFHLNNS
ncbi:MAG: serine/threonine protein phosphatase [Deltaproteobacteria bacterium]|nr:serine/threonine protein phosphatase [Deltaproteobacteria bacterium]